MKAARQTTLARSVSLSGCGVHSNAAVNVVLHPASENTGIIFSRTGLAGDEERVIPALWSRVATTALCTVISDPDGASVSTIEHLLAALSGLGVDNVLVEIDGPEAPIMDGSAEAFVAAIDHAGICELSAPRRFLRVLKTVRVEHGRAFSELRPSESPLRIEVEIDFPTPLIGRQKTVLRLDPATFRRELARARTFGFLRDVEKLWKAGLALGSSLENTVALDDTRVLNPEGLRFPDEFVRHKALDAIGDLALAGAPILGTYRSYCGGHRMNVAVLEALFDNPAAYEWVDAPRLRGGRAEMRVAAAAFAPDRG